MLVSDTKWEGDLKGIIKENDKKLSYSFSNIITASSPTHSERRPKNIYSQEEINLYCIIKLAT